MRFVVGFRSSTGWATQIKSHNLGLNWLDRAREEAGLPALEVERVSSRIPSLQRDPEVVLTEEQARAAGEVFLNDCEVWVKVPKGALNRFCKTRVEITRREESGEITNVSPAWEIQERELVSAWLEAGAPLDWDPTDAESGPEPEEAEEED